MRVSKRLAGACSIDTLLLSACSAAGLKKQGQDERLPAHSCTFSWPLTQLCAAHRRNNHHKARSGTTLSASCTAQIIA